MSTPLAWGAGTDRSLQLGRAAGGARAGNTVLGSGQWLAGVQHHSCPLAAAESTPQPSRSKSPLARKEKGKNVLVDVTRRGGSGGWTAGGSDEDRCLLTPSTLTEFVFHRALAEEAG